MSRSLPRGKLSPQSLSTWLRYDSFISSDSKLFLDSTYGGLPITMSKPSVTPNIYSESNQSALVFWS